MTAPDPRLDDCVLGGYSILLPRPRPDWARPQLPDHIVSRSSCLRTDLSTVWLDAWRERGGDMEPVYREALEVFGLDRGTVDQLRDWYSEGHDVAFEFVETLAAAKAVVHRFLPSRSDAMVIGIGLPRRYLDDLTAEPEGVAGGSFEPVIEMVKRNAALPGGVVLGFEPLVLQYGIGCSWICNGIDRSADTELGIQTNAHGLIEQLDDAARVVKYIRAEGRAEPGLWLPWLLVRY